MTRSLFWSSKVMENFCVWTWDSQCRRKLCGKKRWGRGRKTVTKVTQNETIMPFLYPGNDNCLFKTSSVSMPTNACSWTRHREPLPGTMALDLPRGNTWKLPNVPLCTVLYTCSFFFRICISKIGTALSKFHQRDSSRDNPLFMVGPSCKSASKTAMTGPAEWPSG